MAHPGRHALPRHSLVRVLVAVLMATGLATPCLAEAEPQPDRAGAIDLDDLRAFSDMFRLIRENYVDDIPEQDLLNAAMAGLVADLDDHSEFLPADQYRRQVDSNRGRYGGIGVELAKRRQRLFVSRITPDGPAERAGVQVDDQLLAVDGVPVRGRLLQRSEDALLGEPGTDVEVRIRTGDTPPRDLALTREYLPVSSATGHWLEPGYARLELSHFNEHSDADLRRELERLAAMTDAEPMAGLVLDLRGNRGGTLTSALAIADGFLDGGLVVETRGRAPSARMEYYAQPGQWRPDARVAVLVDALTASASEILAGALQDHGRALVAGQTSFGKGTVQTVVKLRNGSGLKLTTARYFTPSGRAIEQSGIKPDLPVQPPGDAVLSAAMEALKSAEWPIEDRP